MSDTRVSCPHCQTVLKLPSTLAPGKKLKCPKCAGVFTIPEEPSEPVTTGRAGQVAQRDDIDDDVSEPPVRRGRRRQEVEDDLDEPEDDVRREADDADQDYDDDVEDRPRRRRRRRRRRSSQRSGAVTSVAVVNFLLGGLASVCGLLGALGGAMIGAGGAAAVQQPGADPQAAKIMGGAFAMGGAFIVAMALIMVAWGIIAIVAGIGVAKRRQWGRIITLILAGLAAVLGLLSLFNGFKGVFGLAIYGGYAVLCFTVLLNSDNAAEFE